MSASDHGPSSKRVRKGSSNQSQSQNGRRLTRSQRSRQHTSDEDEELDQEEVAADVYDLQRQQKPPRRSGRVPQQEAGAVDASGITYENGKRPSRRAAKGKDYRVAGMYEMEQHDHQSHLVPAEHAEPIFTSHRKGETLYQRLHDISGPFGGYQLPPALLPNLTPTRIPYGSCGPPLGGGADSSDEDDDSEMPVPKTPAGQDSSGGPAQYGKIHKQKKVAGADADPVGVDENVKFDAVGGLDDHINSLKEMVLHPLLYPESFQTLKIQPPRGVLFHGPPGTGKTLLARALSNSIQSNGKKVTFFMRKGADALSKWVGEAERQLRLLFEEAQKCQPSIIFFDEIDGLAPVRSSKTEQIHASIVATLLALMDGMDNRGQVIIIGATNRPDNVDPALRRPGRFDREFYFPLPDKAARLAILDINVKDWKPTLDPQFKNQIAEETNGYGGADIRALCTEAALNAIQGTYPQIYKSDKKLAIDPSKITVTAKDFTIALKKIVPSSLRSSQSQVEPLAKSVEPLLRKTTRGD